MIKTPPKNPEETVLIPTQKLGQPGARGIWATAGYSNGEYGVMLGQTCGESSSLAAFFAESKFAEVRKSLESMPADYREVFEEAIRRLPAFKARNGGFSNASRT
jgi:hypothetical protein